MTSQPAGEPPAFVRQQPTGFYRSLNPSTKLVVAVATAGIAFTVREWTGPLTMLVVVLATIAGAGISRRVVPFVLATAPLTASILLVNTFIYPGAADPLFELGPFTATGTGLAAAIPATLRVVVFALSVAVFSLTTTSDELLSDLERRGVGRRATFVIGAAISTVPRLAARASEIADAQRARGLDTEGSIWKRARGVVPVAGPMIASALVEVEGRTMALEARAFSAPGRRTPLRVLSDSAGQRAARWAIAVGSLALIGLSLSGAIRLP